ncbi:MAG: hypothetical protein KDE31_33040, partial [Caldilineaceae bacterium]|nr:hypothetical protein [Caldilineaceae bacterium]
MKTLGEFDWGQRFLALIYLMIAGCLVGWLVSRGLPVPKTDDAFYKSPAAEWAQNGHLAIPACRGLVPGAERVFACYPPVYQLTLGSWYKLAGVSLTSTLLFSFLVHSWCGWLLVRVSQHILAALRPSADTFAGWLPLSVGVLHLCNLAYFDRQEELAVTWVLCEFLWLGVQRQETVRCRQWVMSGVWIGLAGLTSPLIGVAGALGIVLRGLFQFVERPVGARRESTVARLWACSFPVFGAGLVALLLALTWICAMEYTVSGCISGQFVWLMQHLKETRRVDGWASSLQAAGQSLLFNPPQLPAMLLGVSGWCLIGRRSSKVDGQLLPGLRAYGGAVLATLALVAVVRPEAYTYWGGLGMLALPGLTLTMI